MSAFARKSEAQGVYHEDWYETNAFLIFGTHLILVLQEWLNLNHINTQILMNQNSTFEFEHINSSSKITIPNFKYQYPKFYTQISIPKF